MYQWIVRDGVVPAEVVGSSQGFRSQCVGLDPPGGIWCHITGTDLVRDRDGTIYVLEDNLRCPSGVSYVLQNRAVMKQTFPKVFEGLAVRPVGDYPGRLLRMLEEVAPRRAGQVSVASAAPASATRGPRRSRGRAESADREFRYRPHPARAWPPP